MGTRRNQKKKNGKRWDEIICSMGAVKSRGPRPGSGEVSLAKAGEGRERETGRVRPEFMPPISKSPRARQRCHRYQELGAVGPGWGTCSS